VEPKKAKIRSEILPNLNSIDLDDLTSASAETMRETMGFNIGTQNGALINMEKLENYWNGVILVPERILVVGRMEQSIAGALELVKPSSANKQITPFACWVENFFIAPWARGNGLSDEILGLAERHAKTLGFSLIKISVRETRQSAIKVFEKRGYIKWGTLPRYEYDQGVIVPGFFYYKDL